MRDSAGEKQFVLETVHHLLIGSNFRLEKLQRDDFSRLAVARLVHVAHASVARFGKNVVPLGQCRERGGAEMTRNERGGGRFDCRGRWLGDIAEKQSFLDMGQGSPYQPAENSDFGSES